MPLRTRPPASLAAIAAGLAVAALALPACSRGPRNFENENDRLRRQVLDLQDSLRETQASLLEAEAKLAEHAAASGLPPEVLAVVPRCAGIEIDSLTGAIDLDGAPDAEAVDVYIRAFDGRRRATHLVGSLAIELTTLPSPTESDRTPDRLARVALTPLEVSEAYRATIIGIHYSIRIPLDAPVAPSEGRILVSAAFEDALTGLTSRAERVIDLAKTLRRGEPPVVAERPD